MVKKKRPQIASNIDLFEGLKKHLAEHFETIQEPGIVRPCIIVVDRSNPPVWLQPVTTFPKDPQKPKELGRLQFWRASSNRIDWDSEHLKLINGGARALHGALFPNAPPMENERKHGSLVLVFTFDLAKWRPPRGREYDWARGRFECYCRRCGQFFLGGHKRDNHCSQCRRYNSKYVKGGTQMAIFKRKTKDGSFLYYVSYRDPSGCWRRESTRLSNLKAAERFLEARKTAVAEGRFLDVKDKARITFAELAKDYLNYARQAGRSPERAEYALKPLLIFFGANTLASEIKRANVEDYRDSRSQEVKPGTVFRELTTLRALFNRGVERDLLPGNPAARIRMPKLKGRQRLLSQDEIEALLRACQSSKAKYLYDAVKLCLLTGLRKSELLWLRWADLDLKDRVLVVEHGKGDKQRMIPLCEQAVELLRRLARDSEFVINDQGRQIKSIRRSFNYAVKKTQLPDVVFHDLRHQFGSMLAASGADPFSIRALLGHSDLKTSMIYVHLSGGKLRRAVESLPELTPKTEAVRASESGQNYSAVGGA